MHISTCRYVRIVKNKIVNLLVAANVDTYKPFVHVTKKENIILYVLFGKTLLWLFEKHPHILGTSQEGSKED